MDEMTPDNKKVPFVECCRDSSSACLIISETLGTSVYGALAICRQFTIEKCPHKEARSPSECIKHLARRSKKKGRTKYFIGSQDENLLLSLRDLGGIPLMSIKFNTILLEKPSNETMNSVEKPAGELEKVKELKKEVLGEDVPKKRKRKGPKGPNPLSCKKKKPKKSTQQLQPDATTGQVPGAFGKRYCSLSS